MMGLVTQYVSVVLSMGWSKVTTWTPSMPTPPGASGKNQPGVLNKGGATPLYPPKKIERGSYVPPE